MSVTSLGSIVERFRFTERAEPVRLGDTEPRVHGYAWRHPTPTAALVLVHGLQSHAGWFADAAEVLFDRGLAVYALDRRGSGSSVATRGDIARYTDWFEEVGAMVRLAGAEYPNVPVHLVGHCFGANIALGSILNGDASAVQSLIMLTPGFYVLPDYTTREKLGIAASAFVAPTRRFRVPQDDALFSRDPDVLAWIGADQLGARSLTARSLWQINKMLGVLRRGTGDLRVPLLVFEAAHDRLSDNVRNRALLSRALGEGCRWATFDAEHFLLAESCRDEVLDTLVAWVAKQEA
ncbi:MAG TPA: alpha/beta fold hydrolase [Chloroflexota bacterium]